MVNKQKENDSPTHLPFPIMHFPFPSERELWLIVFIILVWMEGKFPSKYKGAFFQDYSGTGIHGIHALLGPILFILPLIVERTEYSLPWIRGIVFFCEGFQINGNSRNCIYLGIDFLCIQSFLNSNNLNCPKKSPLAFSTNTNNLCGWNTCTKTR